VDGEGGLFIGGGKGAGKGAKGKGAKGGGGPSNPAAVPAYFIAPTPIGAYAGARDLFHPTGVVLRLLPAAFQGPVR